MNSERDRGPREDMFFLKRRWLLVVGLVVLLCVAVGVFLVWHANQPVEPKTVYLMPEPNPKRAEILKQALQPPKHVYATTASNEGTTTGNATVESLEATRGESSSEESEFEDADFELMLTTTDEEVTEEKADFPPIPEGFLENIPPPPWMGIPGYKKGDLPGIEKVAYVLIKLWNQGERGFVGGALSESNGRVYPLYHDVLYVKWGESTHYQSDGVSLKFKRIATSFGTHPRNFTREDFITGEWKTKYPGLKFVDKTDAGYDPDTFLTDND